MPPIELIVVMVVGVLVLSFGVPLLIWRAEHLGDDVRLKPWLKCELWYGSHDAVRHPLGGFKCSRCGEAFDNLEEAGTMESGYVNKNRRIYDRDRER